MNTEHLDGIIYVIPILTHFIIIYVIPSHSLYIIQCNYNIQTAKCYNEMFANTPLSSIVTPGGQSTNTEGNVASLSGNNGPDPSAPPLSLVKNRSASFEESAFVGDKGIDPDGEKNIGLSSQIHDKEPEGLKASMKTSIVANSTSDELNNADEAVVDNEDKSNPEDPPSEKDAVKCLLEACKVRDPPSTNPFDDDGSCPDDEDGKGIENNNNESQTRGEDHVNVVIVDDDDDSMGDVTQSTKPAVEKDEKKEEEKVADDAAGDKETLAEKVIDDIKEMGIAIEHGVEKIIDKDTANKDESNEDTAFPDIDGDQTELNGDKEIDNTSNMSNSDAQEETDEFLNISADGEVLALKATPERPNRKVLSPVTSPAIVGDSDSYFDIHKAAYKDKNTKLEENKDIVKYVVNWEHIVSTRVISSYTQYSKQRKELNHYSKKMESLLAEEERMKERGRPLKPKQEEKLERNEGKLKEAQQTHDASGESLLMLMDEVLLRAYRDAYPLLKKSVVFESEYAEINHAHMMQLSKTLALLDVVGKKEVIDIDGRLESLEKVKPEDMFTGSKRKVQTE